MVRRWLQREGIIRLGDYLAVVALLFGAGVAVGLALG